MGTLKTLDGNEAAARIAHLASEVIAIYPITPASPMGELADTWSAAGRRNMFDTVPTVIEMQSEAGAAGSVHGALLGGTLATTFTASQGLLLMIPNMYKIAGELLPAVFHVAARTVATHALSIFGDHSDVYAVRQTGWAMLASNSVQEAQDMALLAHATTLATQVPFVHFFDGFRTSHEVNKIELLDADDVKAMIDLADVETHRRRALDPDRPTLRGTAQNPDVFFQTREGANRYYDALPDRLAAAMEQFAVRCGRTYHLFDYCGPADASDVIVMMGSGTGAVEDYLERAGNKRRVGLVKVRLFRPFDAYRFVESLPEGVERIAVLDRAKEPGAVGEPLYQDVVTALAEAWHAVHPGRALPQVYGGRFGLSSKEFTPAMVAGVVAELHRPQPRRHFTVGIFDDVTHLSLPWNADDCPEDNDVFCAVFFGLGSDGTVGANKNSVKIIGEQTPLFAQGYFVYDSKKSGSVTVSHLRFSKRPIRSTYLIRQANFVACHQFSLLERMDVVESAAPGATLLLNAPYTAAEVWDHLPCEVQERILDRQLRVFTVDAARVAREAGLGGRINTVMQTCFFALAGLMPREQAIESIKYSIRATYARRGEAVLERNFAAVDASLAAMAEVDTDRAADGLLRRLPALVGPAPDFVTRVTQTIAAGHGDLLPVSALPVDGTFPTGTSRYEKRGIAAEIPTWDADICTACGLCALVCPHAAIRMKLFDPAQAAGRPDGFASRPWPGEELPGGVLAIQVAPDDCTGCSMCVEICPARSKTVARHKALDMQPRGEKLEQRRQAYDWFLELPDVDPRHVNSEAIKGSQLLLPLMEYSGACAGCGETPYLKLMSQLFGDRAVIANATGCSSIYGGNLPTTPWTVDRHGRGPAWANSLFEDNAEFGLGLCLALDHKRATAETLLHSLRRPADPALVEALVAAPQRTRSDIEAQRQRVARLREALAGSADPQASRLAAMADAFVRRSLWIVGGDGWAYDIGFGGLDHVLATDRDVNILVLDTEVYSNTGGQASKATPRGAVAKFASAGKAIGKKDLGMLAVAYGHVYVARIALGANPAQAIRAFHEAESYPGPSLILAYSHCIAHGIDMATGMSHQKDAVKSGYWPLYRYDPRFARTGQHPFQLDSHAPSLPLSKFTEREARFAMLAGAAPERARELAAAAQQEITDRWHYYEQMAGIERDLAQAAAGAAP
ncbi:MAG: pyruvate:ferredoxin (flavodoxin) oxidoreductase [Pirellulales bacterium]|nr:pyruvate:ferredoxin (flavodoxin) oxidoreductase [Pirellulales bacterium]